MDLLPQRVNLKLLLFGIVVIKWNDEFGNRIRLGKWHLSNRAASGRYRKVLVVGTGSKDG